MRIVNMAHGSLYGVGAFVTAWLVGRAVAYGLPSVWLFLLIPVGAATVVLIGAVIEPVLLRPFYRRAEEYQLLVTFGLLLIIEDVVRFFFGGLPVTADVLMDAVPSIHISGLVYPGYYLVVIGVGALAALALWAVIYRTKFGVMLRATSQDRRMASTLGLNVGFVYVSAFAGVCQRHRAPRPLSSITLGGRAPGTHRAAVSDVERPFAISNSVAKQSRFTIISEEPVG